MNFSEGLLAEQTKKSRLPSDPKLRKKLQFWTWLKGYFPDALLAVLSVSHAGNDQHNPGEPLHWARGKSMDQMNAAANHLLDYGAGEMYDTDGEMHLAKAAWRILAQLQLDIEKHGWRVFTQPIGLETQAVNAAIDEMCELRAIGAEYECVDVVNDFPRPPRHKHSFNGVVAYCTRCGLPEGCRDIESKRQIGFGRYIKHHGALPNGERAARG